jgi:ribosomal protein L37E
MGKTETAGKAIACKRCGAAAVIILSYQRYHVYCCACQSNDLLKTYNSKRNDVEQKDIQESQAVLSQDNA